MMTCWKNKYMQKLDGSLSISYYESNGVGYFNPSAIVNANEKCVKIGTDFEYEIPKEIIEDEISRIEHKEKQKRIIEIIPEKKIVDKIVEEYLENQEDFLETCSIFFKTINFQGSISEIDNYEWIRKNIYNVTIIDKVGISRNEYIKCKTILRVNIKTEEIRYIDKKIVISTLNITKRKLNEFKKKLKKDGLKIRKNEAKIYM